MLTIVTNSPRGSATFDASQCYRYRLTRFWPNVNNNVSQVAFIMLNPSQANAEHNDPTLQACSQFAKSWGYTQLEVVNLFAYRTAHPTELTETNDPVGLDNDHYIIQAAKLADKVILAWGNWGSLLNRAQTVINLLRPYSHKLYYLERNRNGQPRHPLYIKRTVEPHVWNNS